MKGAIPIAGDDFIATTSNGFKFGIGLHIEPDFGFIALTCEKSAGGGSLTDPTTWRHLLLENDPILMAVSPKFGGDTRKYVLILSGELTWNLKKLLALAFQDGRKMTSKHSCAGFAVTV